MNSIERQQKLYDLILAKADNAELSNLMLLALQNHFIVMYNDPSNAEFISLVNESVEKDDISFEKIIEIAAKNISINASLVHVTEAMAMAFLSRNISSNEEKYTHKFINTLSEKSVEVEVNVLFNCNYPIASKKMNS